MYDAVVTGTLMSYVGICERKIWLAGHSIEGYRDHELLALGRLLAETAYPRERKELALPGMKIDVLRRRRPTLDADWPEDDEALVIAEVKRSPRAHHAQRLQLGYYLLRLREAGLQVRGELRYPEQRRVEPVELTPELEREVRQAIASVEVLLTRPTPPPPVRIPACTNCAYFEFCWIGEEEPPPSRRERSTGAQPAKKSGRTDSAAIRSPRRSRGRGSEAEEQA